MRWQFAVAAATVALALRAAPAWGHGTPIIVHVANNQLTVSNGVADAAGYANWVFADPDPEAWLTPGPQATQLSTLPGFEVHDLLAGDELSLEVLSRPDFSRPGRPMRWLWYANAAPGEVAIAANDPFLKLVSVNGFLPTIGLLQNDLDPRVTELKLATLTASDLGAHRHTVLYRLDDSGPAEIGVYGFLARLKSPGYQPSEPFLIALNDGVEDAMTFQQGALAINAAAGLAADFDVDGDVDGADFLVWERTLGTVGAAGIYAAADASLDGSVNAADLAIWRAEYGRVVMYPPEVLGAAGGVPEPCAAVQVAVLGALVAAGRRRLTRG